MEARLAWRRDCNAIPPLIIVALKAMGELMRALSIRQPYAEQILRGKKRIEFRSRPTRIRGRFYIYASLSPGPTGQFGAMGLAPGDLPTGVIVGTAELVACRKGGYEYEWQLRNPRRLARRRRPTKHPQPVWFIPF